VASIRVLGILPLISVKVTLPSSNEVYSLFAKMKSFHGIEIDTDSVRFDSGSFLFQLCLRSNRDWLGGREVVGRKGFCRYVSFIE